MDFNATFIIAFVSFIVFIFIMNKILYAPIYDIIQKRKSLIDNEYKTAEVNLNETNKILENKKQILLNASETVREKTLASIDERLNTKHGLVLNNPAYTKYYVQYGEISTYPGGYKENAGIFTHNNAWIICAAAYAGEGNQAFKYYSEIAPAFTEETSDIHKTEPYVYGQMIGGKDAGSDIGQTGKNFGQGKNSWLTGTAAWNMVAISQYILGIQPDFDGLKIDPSIPSDWDGFTATRLFRGAKYNITIKNPSHVCKGVKSMLVDGKSVEGCVVPYDAGKKEVNVEITLG